MSIADTKSNRKTWDLEESNFGNKWKYLIGDKRLSLAVIIQISVGVLGRLNIFHKNIKKIQKKLGIFGVFLTWEKSRKGGRQVTTHHKVPGVWGSPASSATRFVPPDLLYFLRN